MNKQKAWIEEQTEDSYLYFVFCVLKERLFDAKFI